MLTNDTKARSKVLAAIIVFSGALSGSLVIASPQVPAPVIQLEIFGFSVKLWANGSGYTVEVVKSPVVPKPSPIGR